MSWIMILRSIVIPWHNDFISILLYLSFAIYFWIETFLIMGHEHHYKFEKQHDWDFMFIATLGIALSLTATLVFLICYPKSPEVYNFTEYIAYIMAIGMCFAFTFAFIGSELIGTDAYFPFLFLIVAVFIANVVMA